ncbi:16657_t:CDS:2 [Dentiscutata heterogama]|uniref:16657_t:CDS:1 n=1 Tax=Dentiscutata heterogama TaxID=1316150 RepID=A0ACA9K298_9GLOM|nr:16657_t:CDS:2 [Dentiscutata heterogama]
MSTISGKTKSPSESPILNTPRISASSINPATATHPSTPLPSNHQRYKDLLIFEERLKQNLHQLQRRSYKYEGSICLSLPVLLYAVFVYKSDNPTFQFFSKLLLFVAIITLALFFMKNIYSEKVRVASRFVPQCNRVLRQYNMHFNVNGGEIVFYKKVPKKFQEGFERYRQMYYTKKNQRAKEREEKEKMGK